MLVSEQMQIPLYRYLAATWNSSTRGRYLMAMKLFWSKWPSSGCDPKLSQKFSAKLLCQVPFKEQSCAVWSGEELVRLLTIITAYFTEIVWLTLNLHYILLQNKTSERLQNILNATKHLRDLNYRNGLWLYLLRGCCRSHHVRTRTVL